MVDPLVLTTVAFLHIVFAIAWLGGGLHFGFILGPRLRTLSPPATMEFVARVGPSTTRYAEIVGGMTILFGLILLYIYFGGDYTKWPLSLEIGFTLGFIAFLMGPLVVAPAFFGKASDIAKEFMKSPQQGPPPAEFRALLKKGGISSTIATALLLITAVFMVATAFY